jgi:hypothetical protein
MNRQRMAVRDPLYFILDRTGIRIDENLRQT